jgi:Glycosyl hydrolases family 43
MLQLRLLAVLSFITFKMYAQNATSFTPSKLWLDNKGVHINAHGGGILLHNKIYYWFGEHKTAGEDGNNSNVGVHVYASKDLYNWKDEGIALAMHDGTTSLFVKGCIVERPKVIYNALTKTFVMWFHHELKGQGYKAALTGLATSKNITGPYTYIKSVNPNAGYWPTNFPDSNKLPQSVDTTTKNINNKTPEGFQAIVNGYYVRRDFKKGQMARDMTLFVDDDGKAYHIHSSESNQTLHIAELTDDYQSFTGKYTRALPAKTNEAPALFKLNNKYYMFSSGTTGWNPNPARLSVANHPMGPWQELGDPSRGTPEQNKTTFWSQSTHVLPIQGKKNAFIFMGDRWTPKNAIDGGYVWLPVQFENGQPILKWFDTWNLSIFN